MVGVHLHSLACGYPVFSAPFVEETSLSLLCGLVIPIKNHLTRDAWVAQSVKRPTSAQVMISGFVSSSPALGSVLTAQSLEPVSDSVSPSLSLTLPRSCSDSHCLVNNLKKKKIKKKDNNI